MEETRLLLRMPLKEAISSTSSRRRNARTSTWMEVLSMEANRTAWSKTSIQLLRRPSIALVIPLNLAKASWESEVQTRRSQEHSRRPCNRSWLHLHKSFNAHLSTRESEQPRPRKSHRWLNHNTSEYIHSSSPDKRFQFILTTIIN